MIQRFVLQGFPEAVRKVNRRTGKVRTGVSINPLNPNSRAHPRVRRRAIIETRNRVGDHILVNRLRPMPSPVQLRAKFIVPDQIARDIDNYTAILKPVIDGLVLGRVLSKDSSRHLKLAVEIEYIKGERRLEVELESDDPPAGA